MRNTYLDRMGITVWQLRQHNQADFFYYALNNTQGKIIGIIVADRDSHQAVSMVDQENLLQKICDALTVYVKKDISLSMIENLFFEPIDCVILLGQRAQKLLDMNVKKIRQVIRSYSLSDLIHDTEHKKSLWTQLKPCVALFHECCV